MKPTAPPLPARSSGVLLHVTSLPGPYAVGDLGPAARKWVDTLAKAGQQWWQILPLGPSHDGSAPYGAFSAFAGNPLLVSPEQLVADGLLGKRDARPPKGVAAAVDYPAATAFKEAVIDAAFARFVADHPLRGEYDRFRRDQSAWLDDFALFAALLAEHGGRPWTTWGKALTRREPATLASARTKLAGAIDRHAFAQFLFARQWAALREYAADRGVRIIGDVPIFVSGDSADVWCNPGLFLLDRDLRPKVVAGVPPDYFSKTGQRWGNPLYDWRAMAKDNFGWWVARFRSLLAQADLVRIDHFRGFAACWHVPADAPTAQAGKWVKAPGAAVLAAARDAIGGLPFIAEDLGVITPDVEALRDGFGLPGMRVLQFAFDGDPANPFLPHNHVRAAVAYTGTHDNDTTVGWFAALSSKQRKQLLAYAPAAATDPAAALMRLAWQSVSTLAVAPAQDVLRLGSDARMNTPGTVDRNWRWRLPADYAKHAGWGELKELTRATGRASAVS